MSGHVLYLENVVSRILLQVGIQKGLDCLQHAAVAEAHEERMVGVPLCHY